MGTIFLYFLQCQRHDHPARQIVRLIGPRRQIRFGELITERRINLEGIAPVRTGLLFKHELIDRAVRGRRKRMVRVFKR